MTRVRDAGPSDGAAGLPDTVATVTGRPARVGVSADDAVFVTLDGPLVGREAIGHWFAGALAALPAAEFRATGVVFTDDALLLRWDATSAGGQVHDAVDTFVFADGLIRLQTSVVSITT